MPGKKSPIRQALHKVRALYDRNIAEKGLSPLALGWKNKQEQELRFAKLAELFTEERPGAKISVNDLGCGYGSFFEYLANQPEIIIDRYYGYDISEKMLEIARVAVAASGAMFYQQSQVTQRADYSVASGTFYVKQEADPQAWGEYVKQQLVNLHEHSSKGFAFNCLSSYVDYRQDNLFYANPAEFFDFCKRHFSRYVSLLHDYPLHEWTMLVKNDH